MPFILLMIVVPAAIGVILALCRARRRWPLLAIVALCCLSITATYWDEFSRDPAWPSHLVDAILQISMLLVLCDVLPVLIAYEVTRWTLRRKTSAPQRAE